ncbi:MAG: DNA mismatch repair endonuclease MutL [Legionella sp.]|nr:DNA mismatch repair endonuclease MutL [Legionella sp.]
MVMRIVQLPPVIANQIAAGEVIERPASVVKELLENSLDAGADAISIEINYGGLNLIKISDNGLGIFAQDLPLAIAAHATSKIKTLEDLYAVSSMGFRGEALASIASVAKLTITSKTALQEHAMMLRVQDNEAQLSPCARTQGTTLEVTDIFYNAPVRKKFLKSEKLEFQAIESVVKRFAFSAPQIALTLKHNEKLILTLPAAHSPQLLKKRMSKLLGLSFVKNSVFLDVEHELLHLYGWISDHNFQRSHNDKLWVYINQRMVKDKLINHALRQVYDGILYPGRFPACLLYLNLPTDEVDVNVHPTKHEVRFVQPKLIHDFFTTQLKSALNVTSSASLIEKPYKSMPLEHPKSYAQSLYPMRSNKGPTDLPFEYSWVDLNQRYALIFINQKPYLVDVLFFMQAQLQQQLKQHKLPLGTRPLLVPVHLELHSEAQNKLLRLKQDLTQMGLELEFADNQILIRSIPIVMPYLNIRQFLDKILTLENIEKPGLLDIMCQSQQIDSRNLGFDEKIELYLHLEQCHESRPTWSKPLTEDSCWFFLHA